MILMLVADDGQVLDTTDPFTAEELANLSGVGALALIREMRTES